MAEAADVFVLDDSPTILAAVEAALTPLKVRTALLWSELSKSLLAAPRNAVLVCDLEMPGIEGVDFCQIIRRYRQDLRIVFFSSAVDRYPRASLFAVADRVVPKMGPGGGLAALVRAVRELRDATPVG